jgi:hypothetical protein
MRRRGPDRGAARVTARRGRSRPKLDPRLAYLLSLPGKTLAALRQQDLLRVRRINDDARARAPELAPDLRHFAPLTTGLYLAGDPDGVARYREPYVAVFIESDAGAEDLRRLGVRVRSQVGDAFTAFVPLRAVPRLEGSAAVRAIELARPLFPALDQARPYAQVDALQQGPPALTGANVLVGVIDYTPLDIYHPDFASAPGQTRVLHLWDQNLSPGAGEAGPPAMAGFALPGGTYGVEYGQAAINAELTRPAGVPPYQTVRHGGTVDSHGTHVLGIAAGNGRGQPGAPLRGAAPGADLLYVQARAVSRETPFTDSTYVADAFAYLFARAAQLGQPCVVNMSMIDNQGPHDGSMLLQRFLDALLAQPGRVVTVSAGNSAADGVHATGTVAPGATTTLTLRYVAPAVEHISDDIELWYDGQDRFAAQITSPAGNVLGPVDPGDPPLTMTLPNGVEVRLESRLRDPRNDDNLVSVIFTVPAGRTLTGDWRLALTGTSVVNGRFHAWLDRNNSQFGLAHWRPPHRDDSQMTVSEPATGRSIIAVGNHTTAGPPAVIHQTSGRGSTRDGRIKPEVAAMGTDVMAPRSRNMALAAPGSLYRPDTGTSMAAPLVAGTCALLFECRGGTASWGDLLQILTDTASTTVAPVQAFPSAAFGFGVLRAGAACASPPDGVDVWLRDDAADTGTEPFTGAVAWASPDIEVLDTAGNPVPNPSHDPTRRFNNLVRITVRNRGTQPARNTEVYLYWADPATNIPFPAAWSSTGIFTGGAPGFLQQGNSVVVPVVQPGASIPVEFAWAPPAPGANLRGDDHFCLLARLENPADPSQLGAGGFPSVGQRNNVGLRNVHVQPNAAGGSASTAFHVLGTAASDSLLVDPVLAAGDIALSLPIQALPWRDLGRLERLDSRRPYYGEAADPFAGLRLALGGAEIRARTDVEGAERLEVRDGIAVLGFPSTRRLRVPHLRIIDGARIPVRLRVTGLETDGRHRFVHVAQLSGGRRVGGVTLELRKGLAHRDR